MPGTGIKRCTIYTRKSSEEGLYQDYNSLHAQRDACEAFVKSQSGEGGRVIKAAYDDGGFSGGTMERPALQQLLARIRQKLIDVVVVYKVDRLTRSLADFARMIELFDAEGVSFVAVTQQFNTTTPMGQLTLNVLLSFAQFEREVIGERIRDKVAASNRKGIWTGGSVPLVYEVREGKLLINSEEAPIGRQIVERYLELGTVPEVMRDLSARGIASTIRVSNTATAEAGNLSVEERFTTCSQIPSTSARFDTRMNGTLDNMKPCSAASSASVSKYSCAANRVARARRAIPRRREVR
jgi:site-specific DNA recombinase